MSLKKKNVFAALFLAGSLVRFPAAGNTVNSIPSPSLKKASTFQADGLEGLKTKIANASSGDTIQITKSFEIPSDSAGVNITSYISVDKSLTIEGSDPSITIKRAGGLSIFEFYGNGSYSASPVEITLRNITFDGGSTLVGTSPATWMNTGVHGRSILDVANKATLNVDDGVTIRNGWCSNSAATRSTNATTAAYGGAIRVDWSSSIGGGKINLRSGSLIEKCVAINDDTTSFHDGNGYGGGIGAYNYAYLNVYGGTIQNCYAARGGAVGSTYKLNTSSNTSGVINVSGGILDGNYAEEGGALLFEGKATHTVYGGTITNNHILSQTGHGYSNSRTGLRGGAIASTEENNIKLAVDNTSITMSGNDVKNGNYTYGGSAQCYGKYLSGFSTTETFKITFDSNGGNTVVPQYVQSGNSRGDSFPGEVIKPGSTFLGWFDNSAFTGEKITKETVFTKNTTLYAKWQESSPIAVTGISLDVTAKEIKVGDTFSLIPAITPQDATNKTVSYSSKDEGIATVSDKGVVKGLKAGKTTIEVKTADGSFVANCDVTVKANSYEAPSLPNPLDLEITSTSFVAKWNSVKDALSYEFDLSPSDSFDTFVEGYKSRSVTGTSLANQGLQENGVYAYRVRAVFAGGKSGNSVIVGVGLNSPKKGLGAGAIAGIVIGSVFLFILVLIAILYVLWKKKGYRYGVFAAFLVPMFRFFNKLFFKTELNDIERKEVKEEAKKEEKKKNK